VQDTQESRTCQKRLMFGLANIVAECRALPYRDLCLDVYTGDLIYDDCFNRLPGGLGSVHDEEFPRFAPKGIHRRRRRQTSKKALLIRDRDGLPPWEDIGSWVLNLPNLI
jgi:hypothetical protein